MIAISHIGITCNRLWLAADGRIKPCLLSSTTRDIKRPLRAGRLDEALCDIFEVRCLTNLDSATKKPSGPVTAAGDVRHRGMNQMQAIYADLRREARRIAARCPEPGFYRVFSPAVARSRTLFQAGGLSGGLISRLRAFVREQTVHNLGHGPGHAEVVALDAGAIAAIEAGHAGMSEERIDHIVLMAHCAGLLHDIRRHHPGHAEKGAVAARQRLELEDRLAPADIDHIAFAIKYHEAFQAYTRPPSLEGDIIAGSLYDADKFRWGPDNFTHTVWQMIAVRPLPPTVFVKHYPRAITFIAEIKKTFRTLTGQRYGPEFIDIGLEIGNALWHKIKKEIPGADQIKKG